MNSTARIGVLVGAVAVSMGLAITPAAAQDATKTPRASPIAQFFEPGAKIPGNLTKPGARLTIKHNTDYAQSPSIVRPRWVSNLGESCSTQVISKTAGNGKTTLVLSVTKERSVQLSGSAGISKGLISANVGFDVTNTYKVTDETRYEVPRGKHGNIEAYTLFQHYLVKFRDMRSIPHTVDVYKPIGVCFNQWLD
ncbi:hypothetical protein ACFRIC_13295 [Streptomyces sp. NPDC056738]|uniref:hypothetical protein n=1 Tax=Streptomyces sp. NPDC056738 TaxID=3345933 RepID=UPI0036BEEE4E